MPHDSWLSEAEDLEARKLENSGAQGAASCPLLGFDVPGLKPLGAWNGAVLAIAYR